MNDDVIDLLDTKKLNERIDLEEEIAVAKALRAILPLHAMPKPIFEKIFSLVRARCPEMAAETILEPVKLEERKLVNEMHAEALRLIIRGLI